jgi:hypothetical protein
MIRNLDDSRPKEKKEGDSDKDKTQNPGRETSLDPVVTITNSDGKTVSEGPMPFG